MKKEFNFNDVTYMYLYPQYPCNRYTLEELQFNHIDTSTAGLVSAQEFFHNTKESLQRDYRCIQKMWNISKFMDDLKIQSGNKYCFSLEDLEFIVKLLIKYRTNLLWKKGLRKNLTNNNIFELVMNSSDSELLFKEIQFTTEGFIRLYEGSDLSEMHKATFRLYINQVTPLSELISFIRLKTSVMSTLQSYEQNMCSRYKENMSDVKQLFNS